MNAPVAPFPARRRFPRWGWIVIAALSLHVLGMVVAIYLATSDRNFSVVPDYYRRAVDWDKDKARRQASAALGWKLTLNPENRVARNGERVVSATLTDRDGKAVDGAVVELRFFHDAHSRERKVVELPMGVDGSIVARLPMPYEGWWSFEAVVRRGDTEFVSSDRLFVANER
jgi:nitrogen fixation protein FixH